MYHYKKITFFENKKRTRQLNEFVALVENYFQNTKPSDFGDLELIENNEALKARAKINRSLDHIHSLVITTRINPDIEYTPPPSIGGSICKIDVIYNIFNLNQFEMGSEVLLDCIYRAVGIYEYDQKNAFIRTLNPFFWLGLLLNYTASLPFIFIGRIGFNKKRIETSLVGKIFKSIIYLITGFASFLTIIYFLGYPDNFNELFQKLLHFIKKQNGSN